jgi:xylulokinase
MAHKPGMKYLIGIDIGTSSTKTTIVDQDGKIVIWTDEEYRINSLQPGWAEQDPETWFSAVINTLQKAVEQSGIPVDHVAGIGLAGQMHGLVCVDKAGKPLRPAIIWADHRSKMEVDELKNRIGIDHQAEWLGNPLATGFMLPSWLWLEKNEPAVISSTRFLLLPKDYIRFRLTGTFGAEPSDASSTLLFDPHTRNWSQPLLKEIQLSMDKLPTISGSAEIAGGLLPEIAAATGLLSGTPVIFGGSDVSLQALGQGITEPGTISCTIGTGGQLFAPMAQPVHDPQLRLHLFCHSVPNRWHLEAAILSAGLSLRWLRDNLWEGQSYSSLVDPAQNVGAADQGLFFLPYLVGERTPVMDPDIRASFIGLGLEHRRAHLVRAVMEGVVFALRQGLELMGSLGVSIERLVATGGATNHPLWLQLQADIFNRPVYIATTSQTTGFGAAVLAGIGTGLYSDAQAVPFLSQQTKDEPVLPDPGSVKMYDRAYREYCRIYPAVKSISDQP